LVILGTIDNCAIDRTPLLPLAEDCVFEEPLATPVLELLNDAIGIGVAGAKASGKPVSTAAHDSLAIGEHFKRTSLAGRNDGINAEPLFDQGHETRDLGFVVLSRRAGTYLNFHSGLQPMGCVC
jgi:hypothetical protein